MDMVNDGKDTRLDTPQAVKEALASGKDLYNPETGEFWWKYNDTGSIANTYIYLDDPNLLAVHTTIPSAASSSPTSSWSRHLPVSRPTTATHLTRWHRSSAKTPT